MIELAFVVCLLAAPERCEDRRLALLPDIGVMGCMTGAQPQLALWVEANPDYRVVRWTCGWIDRNAASL